MKHGFYLYLFAVAVMTWQFFSHIADGMDLHGLSFAFGLTSSLSHAAMVMLLPLLIYMLFCIIRLHRIGGVVLVIGFALLTCCDLQTITTPLLALQSTILSPLRLLLWLVVYALLWLWCNGGYDHIALIWRSRCASTIITSTLCLIFGSMFFTHGSYFIAKLKNNADIVAAEQQLPFNTPHYTAQFISSSPLTMDKPIITDSAETEALTSEAPATVPEVSTSDKKATAKADVATAPEATTSGSISNLKTIPGSTNVIMVVLDKLGNDDITKKKMPNIHEYACWNAWFLNHTTYANNTAEAMHYLLNGKKGDSPKAIGATVLTGGKKGFAHQLCQAISKSKSATASVIKYKVSDLSAADKQVGTLIKELFDTGLSRTSVIVITANSSNELTATNQHLVPLIVHVPERQPSTSSRRTSHLDILPTILPKLGDNTKPSTYCEGRPLL